MVSGATAAHVADAGAVPVDTYWRTSIGAFVVLITRSATFDPGSVGV